jgi:hypothetical protein
MPTDEWDADLSYARRLLAAVYNRRIDDAGAIVNQISWVGTNPADPVNHHFYQLFVMRANHWLSGVGHLKELVGEYINQATYEQDRWDRGLRARLLYKAITGSSLIVGNATVSCNMGARQSFTVMVRFNWHTYRISVATRCLKPRFASQRSKLPSTALYETSCCCSQEIWPVTEACPGSTAGGTCSSCRLPQDSTPYSIDSWFGHVVSYFKSPSAVGTGNLFVQATVLPRPPQLCCQTLKATLHSIYNGPRPWSLLYLLPSAKHFD